MFCMCRLLVLSIFVAVTYMMTWSIVPRFLKLMIQLSSQVRPIVMFLCSSSEFGFSLHRSLMMLLTAWCCITFLLIFLKCVYTRGSVVIFSFHSCGEEVIIKIIICKITLSPLWFVTRNACFLCFAKPFCFRKYIKRTWLNVIYVLYCLASKSWVCKE